MAKLSKNFSDYEFACSCGCKTEFKVDAKLVTILQKIRDVAGPMAVTSGCRCAKSNAATVGAASKSWHIPRKNVLHAADVQLLDPTRRDLATTVHMYVIADLCDAHGLGLYTNRIHVDTRPITVFKGSDRARWVDSKVDWRW